MTSTFPTDADLDRLVERSDEEVAEIYRALIETDRLSRCCQWHSERVRPPELEWFEAVYCEMGVRGLPTEFVPQCEGANCPTCGSTYETVVDPEAFMHIYRVCRQCRTRRKLGDSVDCRIGSPEPLPEGW